MLKIVSGPDHPSWARRVAADESGGLNVGALRQKTTAGPQPPAATAPFDVVLEREDGSRVPLPYVACEASPTCFRVVVREPRVPTAPREAAG